MDWGRFWAFGLAVCHSLASLAAGALSVAWDAACWGGLAGAAGRGCEAAGGVASLGNDDRHSGTLSTSSRGCSAGPCHRLWAPP